jgi:hypothetical protein
MPRAFGRNPDFRERLRKEFKLNKFTIGHMATRARKLAAPAIAGLSTLAASAMAAVPTEVTASLGDAKSDGVSVATLVLVAVIALFAFKFMRKGL